MDKQEKHIRYVKLNNGEDLIAEIATENELEYTFTNPMKIVVDTDFNTQRQIIFLHPWLPTSVVKNNTVHVHSSFIFFATEVLQDVEEYYVNMIAEIEMSEKIKTTTQKKRKSKKNPPKKIEDNILNFSELLERLKKDKPIH